MELEKIAEGVYTSQNTANIAIQPASIILKGRYSLGGIFEKTRHESVSALFVQEAQKYGRWVALGLDKVVDDIISFGSSESGTRTGIQYITSDKVEEKIEDLIRTGYFIPENYERERVVVPTGHFVTSLYESQHTDSKVFVDEKNEY